MNKRYAVVAMVILLIVALTGCGSKSTSDDAYNKELADKAAEKAATEQSATEQNTDVKEEMPASEAKTTLVVGFDQDFPPMGFVGDDGEFTGFDLDLAKEAATRLNLELVLQPIAWDAKDMELTSGNIDCIWNGFTINGREDGYAWTSPYMANNQVFVVNADAGITTLADLAGKIVVVQSDSSAEAALADAADLSATFQEVVKSADYNAALMDLQSGAVDAVAMDEIVARYQIEKRGDKLVVLDESLSAEEYGVGFLLGNEALRDKIQTTLEAMAADGKMAEISTMWFGKDITTIGK